MAEKHTTVMALIQDRAKIADQHHEAGMLRLALATIWGIYDESRAREIYEGVPGWDREKEAPW